MKNIEDYGFDRSDLVIATAVNSYLKKLTPEAREETLAGIIRQDGAMTRINGERAAALIENAKAAVMIGSEGWKDGGDPLMIKTLASVGTDVKALQELLNQLGASLSVDSEYGDQTEAAVKAFQKKQVLKTDGLYGEKTHAALMAAVSDDDAGQTAGDPEQATEGSETKVVIISEGGKVNIRKGNSTAFGVITAVAPGTTLDYVATAGNGWNAVVVSGQVGWVSGKYSRTI